jgi:hypothetical protein
VGDRKRRGKTEGVGGKEGQKTDLFKDTRRWHFHDTTAREPAAAHVTTTKWPKFDYFLVHIVKHVSIITPSKDKIDSDFIVHMRSMGRGKGIPVNELNSGNIVNRAGYRKH